MTGKVVRTSAKAVIIQNGKLLAIKNHSLGTDWYILPGGGQNHGEALSDALRRECQEEASISVEPGDILFIRDYISCNHEFAAEDGNAHQVEFMFSCTITGGSPSTGETPDDYQTGVAWLPLARIEQFDLYPKILKTILKEGIPVNHPVYLGDVN